MGDQRALENYSQPPSAGRNSAARHVIPVKVEERLHNNMLHSNASPAGVIPDLQQADLVQVRSCQTSCAVTGSGCN